MPKTDNLTRHVTTRHDFFPVPKCMALQTACRVVSGQ